MGLDQLQMAPLVPDDSLLFLFTSQGKVFVMQHETFFIWDQKRHLALCLHLIQPNCMQKHKMLINLRPWLVARDTMSRSFALISRIPQRSIFKERSKTLKVLNKIDFEEDLKLKGQRFFLPWSSKIDQINYDAFMWNCSLILIVGKAANSWWLK